MIDIEKNCGLEELAGRLTTGRDRGPARHGILDMALDDFELLRGDQTADIR